MRIIITFMFSVLLFACQGKKETAAVEELQEWKGMDEFHMIMAESFHPFRDSANVAPARQYARELDSLADVWIANELPAKVDNQQVKDLLVTLVNETGHLVTIADTATEEEIGKSLTSVHDVFHHLQEAWYTEPSEK